MSRRCRRLTRTLTFSRRRVCGDENLIGSACRGSTTIVFLVVAWVAKPRRLAVGSPAAIVRARSGAEAGGAGGPGVSLPRGLTLAGAAGDGRRCTARCLSPGSFSRRAIAPRLAARPHCQPWSAVVRYGGPAQPAQTLDRSHVSMGLASAPSVCPPRRTVTRSVVVRVRSDCVRRTHHGARSRVTRPARFKRRSLSNRRAPGETGSVLGGRRSASCRRVESRSPPFPRVLRAGM